MISSQNTLLRIQLGIIASYILVKFLLRPFILDNEYGGLLKVFVLSYPNFCEAVAGTIFVVFALLLFNGRIGKKGFRLEEKYLPFLAVLIAGVYVILQELKIHNLGGVNVYDPYDIVFSLLGLMVILYLLIRIKPKVISQ